MTKYFTHFKICEILNRTIETAFLVDFSVEVLSTLKSFQNFDTDIETLALGPQLEII